MAQKKLKPCTGLGVNISAHMEYRCDSQAGPWFVMALWHAQKFFLEK